MRRRAVRPARRDKKKGRQVRSAAQSVATTPAPPSEAVPARRPITVPATAPTGAPPSRRAVERVSQPALFTDFQAIGRDLRRVVALGALILVALVVLTFVLR